MARLLIAERNVQLDAGVYHCQQAAEKALKSLLTREECPFPKTHDLVLLGRMASDANARARGLETECMALNPYAVRFRYPGDMAQPDLQEALQALASAERLVNQLNSIVHVPGSGLGD